MPAIEVDRDDARRVCRCIVDHAQYAVTAFGNAAQRMRQRRIVTIGFRSLRLLKNADYPRSLDLPLKENLTRVIAKLVAWDLHG